MTKANKNSITPQPRKAEGELERFVAHTRQPWTEKQLDRLKKLAPKTTDVDLAVILKRPYSSVVNKRQQLGIAKAPEDRAVSKYEHEAPVRTRREAAKAPTKPVTQVMSMPRKLLQSSNKSVTIKLDGAGFSDYLNIMLMAHKQGIEVEAL